MQTIAYHPYNSHNALKLLRQVSVLKCTQTSFSPKMSLYSSFMDMQNFPPCNKCLFSEMSAFLNLIGGGGPIMGDLWALKGLIEEGL